MSERQVVRRVVVQATPELAFEALTRASELREWMCDQAWTEVRPHGRYEVRWHRGYRAEGRFTTVEAPRRAVITWQGTGEPGQTGVEFSLEPVEGGVEVTVTHRGFGEGPEWDRAVSESEEGWTSGLENLQSILETGVDLRLARRPFLGVTFDLLTSERAAREGIPVDQGIYINDTVEGSGARAAGLGRGDVIVALGGLATPGIDELVAALADRRAGDRLDAEVVRGTERRTVQVTLGQRPQMEAGSSLEDVVDRLMGLYQEAEADLRAALEGLSNDEARQRPGDGQWSVVEVLAHLSVVERDQHCYLWVHALDGWVDGAVSNSSALSERLEAVLEVCPTLDGLVNRLAADQAETLGYMRRLPQETLARKARFNRIAFQMVGQLPQHTQEHIQQIRDTIAALRGG